MGQNAAREARSQHDLIQLLNWELAAYEKCNGTRFVSIQAMAKPDYDGCNWRDARVQSDHELDLAERGIVRRVIAQTRREFNVG
jgi:hypothetical protein